VTKGSTTTIYRVTRGTSRKVTYELKLEDGSTAKAEAWFDVSGPTAVSIQSEWEKVAVGPAVSGATSYMGFAGPGITFSRIVRTGTRASEELYVGAVD